MRAVDYLAEKRVLTKGLDISNLLIITVKVYKTSELFLSNS